MFHIFTMRVCLSVLKTKTYSRQNAILRVTCFYVLQKAAGWQLSVNLKQQFHFFSEIRAHQTEYLTMIDACTCTNFAPILENIFVSPSLEEKMLISQTKVIPFCIFQ